jgi:DNA-binding MarR family transcriptional regulator
VPEENSLEHLFHLLHALKRQFHEQVALLDIDIAPMHLRVMKIIDRKKPCTANDIASYLGRDKAQVTRLLNTLIDRGLINKVPNPDDKRSQYLNISDSGMLLVKEIAKIDDNVMAMMRKNLTQDELVEFGRIADVMSKNLESD